MVGIFYGVVLALISSVGKYRHVGRRIYYLNKCIRTINATKEARINEGAKILNMVFAKDEVAVAA